MLQNTSHRPWYGTPVDPTITIWMIKFNDIPALEEALEPGDIACVLAEPAWTNIGIVLPEPGYHKALREITSRTGTLIIVDETHTISAGPGGYTMSHDLQPDMFTLGKPIGSGIPAAIYGLTDQVAIRIKAALQKDGGTIHGIGGKLAGNALSCSHESNFPACADKRGLWTHHPVSKTLCRRGWIGHWGVQVTLEYCAVGVPSWILVPGHAPQKWIRSFCLWRSWTRSLYAPGYTEPGHLIDTFSQYGPHSYWSCGEWYWSSYKYFSWYRQGACRFLKILPISFSFRSDI